MDVNGISPTKLYGARWRSLLLLDLPNNFCALLRVVGPTLESIHCWRLRSNTTLTEDQEHCPNLSSISLRFPGNEDWACFKGLLCSYRSQLRFADLHKVPEETCEQIVTSCPNFQCELKG